MIKISDGWEIDKGAYGGYVLRHNTGRTAYDKKTNTMKPVYDYQIYPASFEDCILRMKDKMLKLMKWLCGFTKKGLNQFLTKLLEVIRKSVKQYGTCVNYQIIVKRINHAQIANSSFMLLRTMNIIAYLKCVRLIHGVVIFMIEINDIVKTYADQYGIVRVKYPSFRVFKNASMIYGVQPIEHPTQLHHLYEDEIVKVGCVEAFIVRLHAKYIYGKWLKDTKAGDDWE